MIWIVENYLSLLSTIKKKKKKNSLCVYKMNDFKEVKEGELSFFPRTDHIAESKSYKW